jgi:predicted transcriptional regulator
MRPSSTQPTDVELALLRVLWDQGPCTVRQVHEVLVQERDSAYTSVLKMLQVMLEKGLVTRDDSERSHVYAAAKDRASTQRGLLRDLLDKAFGGSARELVMAALDEERMDAGSKTKVRELLASSRGKGKVRS